METVDADIGDTCKDLGEVKKVFQLALLCTKRQPSDRPTMHEVVRVLDCLVNPDPPPKSSTQQPLGQLPQAPPSVPSYMNEYVSLRGAGALSCATSTSTSDQHLGRGAVPQVWRGHLTEHGVGVPQEVCWKFRAEGDAAAGSGVVAD